ncbi:MAG: hypothetical protein GX649_06850, partial [Chloroflexi bacterium]|nr:hypothetical protein [Chloroflexota bacterium]
LLFGFDTDGERLYATVLEYTGGRLNQLLDVDLGAVGEAPPFMRVGRVGDEWSLSYSRNGADWSVAGSLSHRLVLSAAGVFASNFGPEPPALVASIDYVMNTAAPLHAHDGDAQGQALAVTPSQTEPVITGLTAIVGTTKALISWTTDVAATGVVNYGLTTAYELAPVEHADLLTEHALMLTGLTPGTLYHVQVSSTASGLTTTTNPFTIVTDPASVDPNPVVDVWYGTDQTFGAFGKPQEWVNILGNVSDDEGIDALSFTLNAGPVRDLTIGPDNMRVAEEGDFNVEIGWNELQPGANQVVITAVDVLGNIGTATVTVHNEYDVTKVWPIPYSVDWSTVTDILDVAQPIDGYWVVEGDTVRPGNPGPLSYDRLLGIGDVAWQDYEVTVPITIHQFYGQDPGVGILTRWKGHTGSGQPSSSYPFGGLGWYRYPSFSGSPELKISGNDFDIARDPSRRLELGVTYVFKMRVWTQATGSLANQQQWYMLKVWEQGTDEPDEWDLSGSETYLGDRYGSIALLAHRTDATFGPVAITEIPPEEGIILSNILVDATDTSATVTWRSSEPGTGMVEYGLTTAYELGAPTSSLIAPEFTINIGGLAPNTEYHFRVTTTPAAGEPAVSRDLTFSTDGPPDASTIRSDDFNACLLDTSMWQLYNPYGDAVFGIQGTHTEDAHLLLRVPGGVTHDINTAGLRAPRVMQAANDTDFQVEVKFESALSEKTQHQGVLVMHQEPIAAHDNDYVHFDFYSDGEQVNLWVAVFPNERRGVIMNEAILDNGTVPLYMRITRVGNTWTVSHSTDGSTWVEHEPFDFGLEVTSIGITGGNTGWSNAPAIDVLVDYFFNTSSPISPEDGDRANLLNTTIVGQGTISKTPDTESYVCGQRVTLTATPADGWKFAGWSGSLSSTTNPLIVTMNRTLNMTATFTQGDFSLTTHVEGEGRVDADPQKDAYEEDDVVTLTALPAAGWDFVGWSGDVTGTDNPTTITITGHNDVTATFEPADALALTVNTVGQGTVARDPDMAAYVAGTEVTLTAMPAEGWVFTGWSGDLSGNQNPTTITMDSVKTVTATFIAVEDGHTLNTAVEGQGRVDVSPAKDVYDEGEVVTLTAVPDPGWSFVGWSGDLTGSDNPATITVNDDITITATFEQSAPADLMLPLIYKLRPSQ